MSSFLSIFGFDPAKHSVKVEVLAGLTTFLTMSYILAVNPIMLSDAGMDKGAVFSATVIAAIVGTLIMAVYAKLPFAQASGMGLNAFFAYTLVISMGYTWQQALAIVLVEGLVFILLTIFKVRESIVHAIPLDLRYSLSVGIGLFIAYLGLQHGGIIVPSDATMTGMGPWTATSLIAMAGIIVGATLLALKVRGALFYTILLMIPSAATTSALFLVGVMMMHPVLHNDFMRFLTGVPCFVTILMMPFTASISEGIVLGMLSYILIKVCTGEGKQLSVFMYVLGVVFLLKYIAPYL